MPILPIPPHCCTHEYLSTTAASTTCRGSTIPAAYGEEFASFCKDPGPDAIRRRWIARVVGVDGTGIFYSARSVSRTVLTICV